MWSKMKKIQLRMHSPSLHLHIYLNEDHLDHFKDQSLRPKYFNTASVSVANMLAHVVSEVKCQGYLVCDFYMFSVRVQSV